MSRTPALSTRRAARLIDDNQVPRRIPSPWAKAAQLGLRSNVDANEGVGNITATQAARCRRTQGSGSAS
jgi:hypothetical protein